VPVTARKIYETQVPLFLIPVAIANGVRQRGAKLFRISVVRTSAHQYRIQYKCRAKDTSPPYRYLKMRYRRLGQETLAGFIGGGRDHD
jgi:hypothetical protein